MLPRVAQQFDYCGCGGCIEEPLTTGLRLPGTGSAGTKTKSGDPMGPRMEWILLGIAPLVLNGVRRVSGKAQLAGCGRVEKSAATDIPGYRSDPMR